MLPPLIEVTFFFALYARLLMAVRTRRCRLAGHQWESFGDGYRCRHCDVTTEPDDDLPVSGFAG